MQKIAQIYTKHGSKLTQIHATYLISLFKGDFKGNKRCSYKFNQLSVARLCQFDVNMNLISSFSGVISGSIYWISISSLESHINAQNSLK
jgi:hypothetical protein